MGVLRKLQCPKINAHIIYFLIKAVKVQNFKVNFLKTAASTKWRYHNCSLSATSTLSQCEGITDGESQHASREAALNGIAVLGVAGVRSYRIRGSDCGASGVVMVTVFLFVRCLCRQ